MTKADHRKGMSKRAGVLRWHITRLALLAFGALVASKAVAAPPPNDNFANSIEIVSGGGVVSGTNVEATSEFGEPNHAKADGGRSVWWRWTASTTGTVTLDTATSDFDTVMGVYTGASVGALTLVVEGDDLVSGTFTTRIAFSAEAGTTYHIAVDGFSDGSGGATGAINLSLTPEGPGPANDNFVTAAVIPSTGGTFGGSTTVASREAREPLHAGGFGMRSVWWQWTPVSNVNITIDTAGSDFDTLLAVYTGSTLPGLQEVASNDDDGDLTTSSVSFSAVDGTTYWIAVDGYGGASGAVTINVGTSGAEAPANDLFANAAVFLPGGGTVSGSNVGAGKEIGEPAHSGNTGGKSVWWSWTANADGPVSISTAGSNFYTLLAVYTGDTVGVLTEVASNNDPILKTSRVDFNALSGTAYRIAVDGWLGESGDITMTINALTAAPAPPVANGATGVTSSAFDANWTSVSGAAGYRIDVSTSTAFDSFVAGYQDLDVGAVASWPVTGLTQSTTYYYRVRAYNLIGIGGNSQTITVVLPDPNAAAPTFTMQPPVHSIAADGTVSFTVEAAGFPAPTVRWQISTDGGANWNDLSDNNVYSGVSSTELRVTSATLAMNGNQFRAVATNSEGSTASAAGVLNVAATAGPRLINLSTRAFAGSGDTTLIVGFYILGSTPKTLLIRGIGPHLQVLDSSIPSVVADPALTLYSGSTPIAQNNDWQAADASSFAAVGAFALNPGSKDAALVVTLDPGSYTVHLNNPGASAEALVEVYDLSRDLGSRLINLSCRLNINPGQTVIVGTYLLGGTKSILLRSAGPGLVFAFPELFTPGVVLPDPKLTLFSGSTPTAENDDWSSSLAADFAAVGAFGYQTGSKDAAIKPQLTQGPYTVHATGTGAGGVALIELYEMP